MLGCRMINSDVFIFFEKGEVGLLESQKIETDISKNDKEEISLMQVLIHYRSAYPRLVEKGSFGDHQGYRHVYLLDIKRGLDKNELDIYNYLKRKVNG